MKLNIKEYKETLQADVALFYHVDSATKMIGPAPVERTGNDIYYDVNGSALLLRGIVKLEDADPVFSLSYEIVEHMSAVKPAETPEEFYNEKLEDFSTDEDYSNPES